ncbi:MAG: DNA-processing protein DprA [Deltaproteobacteria bacterium]|nr:DNA-processing protein DprA [Deltaproteobacteria bacterium]
MNQLRLAQRIALAVGPGLFPSACQVDQAFGRYTAAAATHWGQLGLSEAQQVARYFHDVVLSLQSIGAFALFADDPRYPQGLSAISSPPPVLFVRGCLPTTIASGVVGARGALYQSIDAAQRLAGALVEAGHAVVSGGAIGVDAAAHRGAIDAGGATVAIIGSGLAFPYPPVNRALFDRIVEAGGAVVSPFVPQTRVRGFLLVKRNALIAAWSTRLFVIEAAQRSGALSTARHASRIGRPVFARPVGEGARWLISSGKASAFERLDQLVAQGEASRVDTETRRWLECLQQPIALTALAERLGCSPGAAAARLMRLQFAGLVSLGGGLYRATTMGLRAVGASSQSALFDPSSLR